MDKSIKNILQKSYDNFAHTRDNEHIDAWKLRELEKVAEYIKQKNTLLDLGAGTGIYGKYFQDRKAKVTCIDLSAEMISLCRKKGLEAMKMDFYNLDFLENSFDIVFSFNSLLHVPKKSFEKVLLEIKHILAKNGIFYLGIYGGKNSEGIWEDDFYRPKRFFSFYENADLRKILEKHFEIIDFSYFHLEDRDMDFQSVIMKV